MKSFIKKYLLLFLGTLFLIIGLIGILIPILPTTPFILLTSYCYLKSSTRLYKWLTDHKAFGPILTNYIEHKAVSKKIKIKALLFLWTSLIISMIIVSTLYLSILLTAIGIGVSVFILSLNTLDN